MQNTRGATVAGFGAILLWSMSVAIVRSLSEQVGPVTAAAAVYSVSGITALMVYGFNRRRSGLVLQFPIKYLFGCGLLFVGYMLSFYLAIGRSGSRQQVLEVGLLNYLWPVLTLILSLVFLGKKAGWGLWWGTVLALTGIFLVVTQGTDFTWQSLLLHITSNPSAYSLALVAAVTWALYSNLTRKWAGGQKAGAVVVFLPGTALVLIGIGCFLPEPGVWSWRSLAEAFFLGVITYVAYALWDHSMRRGNVVMVAAASYLTPLFSTIVSCLYLAVVPGVGLWAGCGILILGSVLSWRSVSDGSSSHG